MALVVGTNSWSTVAEADDYLEDRLGSRPWFDLVESSETKGEESKEVYLTSAFYWLMGAPQLEIGKDSTDDNVKNAQAEAALWLIDHYDELDARRAATATGVTDFSYSKRRESLDPKNIIIPPHILGMLADYEVVNTFAQLKGEYDQ